MESRWLMLLVVNMAVLGWSQPKPRNRFALTTCQVARAIANQGIQIIAEQVSLPAYVVATEPNPVLDVVSVGPLEEWRPGEQFPHRSWIRMTCHELGMCLPFYAIATMPESSARPVVSMTSTLPLDVTSVSPPTLKTAITIRAGAHATLVMDDSRSHIQVSVISLENGIVGHSIRVMSPDHKRVYVAEVISANVLKRSF